MKSLPMLIRWKRMSLDEATQALNKLEQERIQMYHKLKAMKDQLEHEKQMAADDVELRISWKQYYHGMIQRMEKLVREIQNHETFMEPVRDSVKDKFIEVKNLEVAQENLQKEEHALQEKRLQEEIDDITTMRYNRSTK
ncbi:MAG: flagellar export protein FliJ [Alphaproteobacteria bacterium]